VIAPASEATRLEIIVVGVMCVERGSGRERWKLRVDDDGEADRKKM
jgi:hypothetical protein